MDASPVERMNGNSNATPAHIEHLIGLSAVCAAQATTLHIALVIDSF